MSKRPKPKPVKTHGRSEVFQMRLTPDERKALEQKAGGKPLSAYLREKGLAT
jgi:hypothetical protein